ncbi:hypothetical protein DERF_012885 [Dermatophagoides farinae]|uniref:Uncharacterized protein n=1 Tax=Dermatophagoides farinae TaxID=6954 RepID=A0A922HT00_DERFA|nr:hypothetical protein DERF_012885 [Dermatophagoides farinae]
MIEFPLNDSCQRISAFDSVTFVMENSSGTSGFSFHYDNRHQDSTKNKKKKSKIKANKKQLS